MHTRSKTDRDRRLDDRNVKKALQRSKLAKNRPRRRTVKNTSTSNKRTKKQPIMKHQTMKRHSKFNSNRSPVARLNALWGNISLEDASSSSPTEVEGVPPTPASSPTEGIQTKELASTSISFTGIFQFGNSTMQFNVGTS